MSRKNVQVLAETVCLLCPHCGQEVPDPEKGSFFWTKGQLSDHEGTEMDCPHCDEPVRIVNRRNVRFE